MIMEVLHRNDHNGFCLSSGVEESIMHLSEGVNYDYFVRYIIPYVGEDDCSTNGRRWVSDPYFNDMLDQYQKYYLEYSPSQKCAVCSYSSEIGEYDAGSNELAELCYGDNCNSGSSGGYNGGYNNGGSDLNWDLTQDGPISDSTCMQQGNGFTELFYNTGEFTDVGDRSIPEIWKFQIDPTSADAPTETWRCHSMIIEVLQRNDYNGFCLSSGVTESILHHGDNANY